MPDQTPRDARYNRFVGLIARHDLAIRRFVRSLLPCRDGVDDVVQDTALECWSKFEDFEAGGVEKDADEFIRWACVIARYKVMSWQRDSARDRLVFRENVIAQLAATAMDDLNRWDAERRSIEHCLDEMENEARRLVLSVHSPGDSIARIAEETGQQARRLYSKINVLRKMLLDCVQQRMTEELT